MSQRTRYKLSLSVFLILEKDDKILMIQRGNTGWMDGFYSLPAGAIEGDRPLTSEIIREAKEEVGIDLKSEHLTLVHTMHTYTAGNEWVGIYFHARDWAGTPTIKEPHKHSDIAWFDKSDLPRNTIPYVRQAIVNSTRNISYSEFGWDVEG